MMQLQEEQRHQYPLVRRRGRTEERRHLYRLRREGVASYVHQDTYHATYHVGSDKASTSYRELPEVSNS